MTKVPHQWLPKCRMDRVITHWTAGLYKASDNDKAHYHILVEDDGNVVKGKHSIRSNSPANPPKGYAAHTSRKNSYSIGISCCCMANAVSASNPGDFPMTEKQWTVMAEVTAQLCQAYNIVVSPMTVLGHGEVQKNLGTPQAGKWDPLALPWKPDLSSAQAGDLFRATVQGFLSETEEDEPVLELKAVIIQGHTFTDAINENGSTFVDIDPLVEIFGVTIESNDTVNLNVLFPSGNRYKVPYTVHKGQVMADCADLARIFNLTMSWNTTGTRLTLQ